MNYITEARRLGIDTDEYLTPILPLVDDRLQPLGEEARDMREEDGLHITGCTPCRTLRNAVREAREAEENRFLDELDQWYAQFEQLDFEEEEEEDEPVFTQGDVDFAYRSGVLDALHAVRGDVANQQRFILGELDKLITKREDGLYA